MGSLVLGAAGAGRAAAAVVPPGGPGGPLERYQVKTDQDCGIVNDRNAWSREVGNPFYVLDLLTRIVTISAETVRTVRDLPPIDFAKLDL